MLGLFSLWYPSPLPLSPPHPPPPVGPPRESREKTNSKRPQSIWFASSFTMLFRKSLLGRFPGAFTRPEIKINMRALVGRLCDIEHDYNRVMIKRVTLKAST